MKKILCPTDFSDTADKAVAYAAKLCKKIGADTYINPSGIKGFYNHENFKENGIRLFYIENNIKPYRQFNNDFISHLSIIDVLMFNAIEDVNILLDDYKLI